MFPKNLIQFFLTLILSLIFCVPFQYFVLDDMFDKNMASHIIFAIFTLFFILIVHLINFKNNTKISYNFGLVDFDTMLFAFALIWIFETLLIIPFDAFFYNHIGFKTSIDVAIAAVIVAPVLEELVFRNILLNSLLNNHGKKKSILITAILFGVIHIKPSQVVIASLIGVILGIVYSKNRNILSSIILHSISNLTIILLNLVISKFSNSEFFNIIIFINLLFCLILVFYFKTKRLSVAINFFKGINDKIIKNDDRII